jgi:hypothetical protein
MVPEMVILKVLLQWNRFLQWDRRQQRSLGSNSKPRGEILVGKFSRSTACTAHAVQRCMVVTQHWQSGVFLKEMPDTQG